MPFEVDHLRDLLFAQVSAEVPNLHLMNARIPRVLNEVVQRLLRKSPQDRYQSAKA